MGAVMRAIDWAATPLGPVASWPHSLRTALSMMLGSRFPMAVAWGPELRWFYNDGYQAILGARHPGALGAPAAEVFGDAWAAIGPELARASRGDTAGRDDAYLPTDRGGRRTHRWFALSCSPIRDERGVGGVLVIAAETTARVEAERRLAALFEHVPAAIAVLRGDDLVVELANRRYAETIGEHRDLIGRRVFDALPHLRGRGLELMIAMARRTGEPCIVKEMAIDGRWWSFVLAPIELAGGAADRILSFAYEVTDMVLCRQHAEAANALLQDAGALVDAALASAPIGLSIYDRELRLVQINDTLARWNGFDRERVIGRPLAELLPPDSVDRVIRRVRRVFATGTASETMPLATYPLADPSELRHWLVTYYPVCGASGEVVQVGVVVVDVTRQRLSSSTA
jgi:PAS domain S-box-containing protein